MTFNIRQFKIVAFAFTFSFLASVEASESISYSGRLVNTNGSPVSGPVNLKFEFAYTNSITTILCSKTITGVALTNGVFHVKLDPDCPSSSWMEVLSQVPSGEALSIRVTDQSNAKAYSFQALHSMPFSSVSMIAKQIAPLGATSAGQVLQWNGSAWEAGNISAGSGGTVTSVATGAGLTGGPITNSGTISIANGGVDTAQLADNSVTDLKIASGISRNKLANGTASHVLVNDGAGVISSVAQLPITQGGTGAANAAAARTNLGLGTSAVVDLGNGIGMAMPSDTVPVCMAFEKLQMTAGPAFAWACVPDNDSADNTKLPLDGSVAMTGNLDMDNNLILDVATPTADGHAANKLYVDTVVGGVNSSQWATNGSDISYSAGNVGIGITTPSGKFTIRSNAVAGGVLKVEDGSGQEWLSVGQSAGLVKLNAQGGRTTVATPSGAGRLAVGSMTAGSVALSVNGVVGQTADLITADLASGSTGTVFRVSPTGDVSLPGKIRLKSDTVNYVELSAPTGVATNITFKLPGVAGSAGNALVTDGAGNLSWSSVATSSTAVGGDISGTIDNAQIIANSVSTNEIANASVTYAKTNFADGEIPQAKVNGLVTSLSGKEPAISNGTNLQYWSGDKSWQTLNTTAVPEGTRLYFTEARVLATDLTGFSTASTAPVLATDSIVEGISKLQAQITANDNEFNNSGVWGKTGSDVHYTAGNVGVGTTTPTTYKLSVYNSTANSIINNESGGVGTAAFSRHAGLTGASVARSYISGINISDSLGNFEIYDQTSGASRVYINNAGHIGMNTTSPGSTLDVKGVIRLSGSTSGYVGISVPAAAGSVTYVLPASDGTSGQLLSTNGSGQLSWQTGVSSVPSGAAGGDLSGTYPNPTITGLSAAKIGGGTVDNTEYSYLNGVTSSIQTQINSKESAIAAGTAAQYRRGDKTWQNFDEAVRNAFLIGYGTGTAIPLASTDTVMGALGKLEAQVTAANTTAASTYIPKAGGAMTGTLTSPTIGIGTATPEANLHVQGSVKIVDGNQAAEKVLTSDANGNATWHKPKIYGQVCAAGTYLMGYDNNGNKVCGSTLVTFANSPQSGGGSHQCAIMSDSTVACWGYNGAGQLGNNTVANQTIGTFVRKSDGSKLSSVTSLSLSFLNSCAVTNGEVYCWGDNAYYQGGIGTTADTWLASRVPGITTAVQVSGGAYHTCARLSDGTVKCWGINDNGQIGNNTLVTQTTPVFVLNSAGTGSLTGVTHITSGSKHTCAIISGGVVCWGDNAYGMLGDGTVVDKKLPVATISMNSGVTDLAASLSYFYDSAGPSTTWRTNTCAVKSDGTVWCWGRCAEKQCGYSATPTANMTTPVQVQIDADKNGTAEGPLTGVVSVTLGALYGCAIKADTTAVCWGANPVGNLGDGTITTRNFAVPVVGIGGTGVLSNIKGMALTGQYNNGTNASTIAILNDGNAVGFGSNTRGQIGDNSITNRTIPVGLVQP